MPLTSQYPRLARRHKKICFSSASSHYKAMAWLVQILFDFFLWSSRNSLFSESYFIIFKSFYQFYICVFVYSSTSKTKTNKKFLKLLVFYFYSVFLSSDIHLLPQFISHENKLKFCLFYVYDT